MLACPHLHRVWSFVRMSFQSCTQEVVEELADGFGYSISLDRDQLHRTIINNQGCSESEDESTLSVTEACRMRALQAGMMQRLSESVLPAFPSRVLCSVITSLCRYSGSSTAHQVLDQLFPSAISCWEPGWAKGRIAGSPCGFHAGPCSWPLCTSALMAHMWRAMPNLCQATWSTSRPLRLNRKSQLQSSCHIQSQSQSQNQPLG
ncbi:uncharacterized protein [Equus caballus]|uniref:uncharacterized protein isoform X2 n=1 Tax=Equus caballus TaxID=9796 RepID=UPI0038B24265